MDANHWFNGSDNRSGLDPEDEYERLDQMHCCHCGQAIERVRISVYIEPFCQVLVACSETCAADLRARVEDKL